MKTDEQVDSVELMNIADQNYEDLPDFEKKHHSERTPQTLWCNGFCEGFRHARANPPRVDGFQTPELVSQIALHADMIDSLHRDGPSKALFEEMHKLDEVLSGVNQRRVLLDYIKELQERLATRQPAPEERKGDRGRAWGFAMDVFKSAGMSPDNPLFAHIQKCMMQHLCAQAPTGPTREQVAELVEAAREVVKWIHYSPYRSALEKALAPFADKGGSNG